MSEISVELKDRHSEGIALAFQSWMEWWNHDIENGEITAKAALKIAEEGYEDIAAEDMLKQAEEITAQLKVENIETDPNLDIIALIAYLQRLGTDINVSETVSAQ